MDNSTASLIALLVVGIILVLFTILGYRRGFFRVILTTLAFVVTIVVAGLLAPKLAPVIEDSFIGKNINKGIETFVDKNVGSMKNKTSKELQEQIIGQLPLPSFVQKDFLEKNTADTYHEINAKGFKDYLKTRLSVFAINIVTYLILMVLVYLVIRILLRISKLLNNVPVIGGINRLFGALIGLFEGLLIVWLVGLLIMALAGTKFGMNALEVIESNPVLKFLYDHNGIIIGGSLLFRTFL